MRASLLEPIGLHAKWYHPKLAVEKQDAPPCHRERAGETRRTLILSLALAIGPHATGIRAIVGAVSIRVDRKPSREMSTLGYDRPNQRMRDMSALSLSGPNVWKPPVSNAKPT